MQGQIPALFSLGILPKTIRAQAFEAIPETLISSEKTYTQPRLSLDNRISAEYGGSVPN
jgi:hypothetical protein